MRLLSTFSLFALLLLTGCGADNGVTSSAAPTPQEPPTSHQLQLDDDDVDFPFGYVSDVVPYTSHSGNTSYSQTYFICPNDMMVDGRMTGTGNVIKIWFYSRTPAFEGKTMRADFPHASLLVDDVVVLCGMEYMENYNPETRTSTRRLLANDGVLIKKSKDGKEEFYLDATFTNPHDGISDATDLLEVNGTWRDKMISVVVD